MSELTPTPTSHTKTPDFAEITRLIESARQRAYQAVNTALIELYLQVGAYLSAKIKAAEWGEGVVLQREGREQRLALTPKLGDVGGRQVPQLGIGAGHVGAADVGFLMACGPGLRRQSGFFLPRLQTAKAGSTSCCCG